jgi:hypothetical protein
LRHACDEILAIPYAVGTIAMVWFGLRSDRLGERRFHTAIPLFIAAAGIDDALERAPAGEKVGGGAR